MTEDILFRWRVLMEEGRIIAITSIGFYPTNFSPSSTVFARDGFNPAAFPPGGALGP